MISAPPGIITGAVILDIIFGDPHRMPHPVAGIGRFISEAEGLIRQTGMNARMGGILLAVLTIAVVSGAAWLLLLAAGLIHPHVRDGVSLLLAYTCLAARSLHKESKLVADALKDGNIEYARKLLSRIVGRDTDDLDDAGVWRALVETVSENTNDGVIAPLLCLMIGGPILGLTYKAINTLDSMVGYRNDRYRDFGWASARLDDLVNWLPARFTGLLMSVTAPLFGLSFPGAWNIMMRDGRNHSSPNSGVPEAAAAGALGVRLGGASRYFGQPVAKPTIGDPLSPLSRNSWVGAVRLMYGAEGALLIIFIIGSGRLS